MSNAATATIAVTEQAEKRIGVLLSSEAPGSVFRVTVEGGGCSGFQYQFAISPAPDAEDAVIEQNGARVAIDPASLGFLLGSRIDFIDDLMGQSFRIDNPNATASCGCGASFSI